MKCQKPVSTKTGQLHNPKKCHVSSNYKVSHIIPAQTLSTRPPATCRHPSTPCAATLLATSLIDRKKSCSAVLGPPF